MGSGVAMHRSLNVRQAWSAFSSMDDDNGYDTHVAGIIGATNDGQDVVGVAPGTVIYSIKMYNERRGSTDTFLGAVNWLVANAAQQVPPIKVVTLPLVIQEDSPGSKWTCASPPRAEQKAIWCVRRGAAALLCGREWGLTGRGGWAPTRATCLPQLSARNTQLWVF